MTRDCGECSVCCSAMAVDELGKAPRFDCQHDSVGGSVGCAIYPTRPASCRRFVCGWLQGELREGDRPDRLGIMLTGGDSSSPLARDLGLTFVIAHEIATGALDEPALLAAAGRLARTRVVVLLGVEGNERIIGPERLMRRIEKWDRKARRCA